MTLPTNTPGSLSNYGTEDTRSSRTTTRRVSTETKAALKTTELVAYVAAVVAVIVVSLAVKTNDDHGDYFRADKAMFYIVLLTLGYLGSRGLAKSGSRDFYDDDRR
ncbi:MAG: sle [Pseudonocardiales bacterium]|nr:sle [Pseudonocardiales bacterium]